MRIAVVMAALALGGGAWPAVAQPNPPALIATPEEPAVRATLDQLHAAASRADAADYFALFTRDAIYIGTDATERWTLDQFRAFAEPYFRSGRGWTYTLRPGTRHISWAADQQTAWFDEILDNASYGTTRGTGVLVRTPQGWRIAQYHLTIPMPNALAREFVARIRENERTAEAPPELRDGPAPAQVPPPR